ncbi:MAG: indole-3-glycerol phosphate synthase TrpC [Acidimicrobiales bacterium]
MSVVGAAAPVPYGLGAASARVRATGPGTTLAPTMPTYLADIVAAHRRAAAADGRDLGELMDRALASAPPPPFGGALLLGPPGEGAVETAAGAAGSPRLAVIAEIKRRSPSRGLLAPDLDPAATAGAYAAGGATCLSVLTDRQYFGGSASDLVAARLASGLPALRKDFTVSVADVCDARLMGASAVLLIVAALADAELTRFLAAAGELGIDALVEVHDGAELDRALSVGAGMVGVNQRDLATFAVDPDRAERLAEAIPDDVVAVAESGIAGRSDAARLAAAGYRAVLVGEALVRAADPSSAVAALAGHPVAQRPARAGGGLGAR